MTEWVECGWIVSETSLVWCLQRFEHSTGYHKKISTYVSFPEELDMTPFMSNTQHHGATEDQLTQDSMLPLSSENKWVMLFYCDWKHGSKLWMAMMSPLTLWCPLLTHGYSYKAFCARPLFVIFDIRALWRSAQMMV